MMMTAARTPSAKDTRRIAASDPDFVRLHASTQRKLRASVRTLVRELRALPAHEHAAVQSRFIARHVAILRDAYMRAHQEGQRDYWQQVSLKSARHIGPVNEQRMRQVLGFYAPSVAKMAAEAQQAWQRDQAQKVPTALSEGGAFRFADADAPPKHTGIMVAFLLAPAVAARLALPDGEPASDLHITLAYLGDVSDLAGRSREDLDQVVASYAAEAPSLSGRISGVGRFLPTPSSESQVPIIALVNVPGLQEWRAGLCQRLEAEGIHADATFAYTPHITLAYVAEGAPMPAEHVPPAELVLDQVTVAMGDDRRVFRVGASHAPLTLGEGERVNRLDDSGDPGFEDWLSAWLTSADPRIEMQANLAWPALNDGYYDGPLTDPANPFYYVYWDLEPLAVHCGDCPDYADGSPYTPPGSGVNELNATPGDGHTACGAGCKCGLRYGSGGVGDQTQLTWNQAWKYWQAHPETLNTTSPALAAAIQGMPAPVVLPNRDDLTDDQKGALDAYRAASIAWDLVRGALDPLPGLFSDAEWTPPDWTALTPAQQDALTEAAIAMVEWGEASDAVIAEAFQNLGYELAEL